MPPSARAQGVDSARDPGSASTGVWLAATLLGSAAAVVFHLAPSLPLGVAFDEPLKVSFVLKGEQNFQHPILMLQLVRVAALLTGAADKESVFALGRLMAAISGGLLVV